MMSQPILSRGECSALRGLAILGIVLHNFCHWLRPAVKENEYTFTWANAEGLLHTVAHPSAMLPIDLLSFFGHYGVPIFLLLSGYGLVLKYERMERQQLPFAAFTEYHYLKLFRMMAVGFIAFLIVDSLTAHAHRYHTMDIAMQLLMLNNLMPDPDHIIWPGPYWFFGLMLQLYIVYRLLLYRRHWGFTVGLMLICWAVQAVCAPESEELNRWRYNFVGGMVPFGLGILLARFSPQAEGRLKLWLWLLGSVVAVFAFSLHYQLWFWAPVFVCTGGIALVKLLPRWANGALEWTGAISAALFVCHPITRKLIIPIAHQGDIYLGLAVYLAASIALALVFRWIIRRLPSPNLENLKQLWK